MSINIAIDGPAGAGKSTVAKRVSKELGFIYVDTGALYRAVGLAALRLQKDPKEKAEVLPLLPDLSVSLRFVNGDQRVFLGEEDVSEKIRTAAVSMAASDVSAIPEVRSFLFDLQKDIASKNDCIMDGRDIGTVVLPKAKIKLFVTASPEARAQRRYKELLMKGQTADYDDVLRDMNLRDEQDTNRKIAPLKQAPDAVLVDTSNMDLEESVAFVLKLVREKLQK